MRLLHTSDWHLGATLAGHERLAEQALFLQWLLDTAVAQQVHAILIAGDIYDTVNPPVEAQRLFAHFLVELRRLLPHACVVATAGNHDSAARLEAPAPFALALGNLHLVGSAEIHGERCLLALPGPDGQPAAWCLAVPFLRPSDLDCKVQVGESPEAAFARTVQSFYANLRELAIAQNPHLPRIALGHCTLSGSERAGSERLLIGGVESLPASALATGMDYVALGHIHRAQKVGSESVRYSGSPYAMDCDERRYTHQVLLVEVTQAGEPVQITAIPTPALVPLLRFPRQDGTWEQLESEVRTYDWEPYRKQPRDLQPLVEFAPQGTSQGLQLREQVENLCAGLPFRLVRARWVYNANVVQATPDPIDLSSQQAPEKIFLRYFAQRSENAAPSEALLHCFRQAVDAVAVEGP